MRRRLGHAGWTLSRPTRCMPMARNLGRDSRAYSFVPCKGCKLVTVAAHKSAGEETLPGVHINGRQARLVRGHDKLADDKEHNQQNHADAPAPVNELEFNGIQRFVFHLLDFFVKLNFRFRFHNLLRILD